MASKSKYVTISLPTGISDEIDGLIEELGYWPSRGAFVREACLTKIKDERRRLHELRNARVRRPNTRNRSAPRGENGLKRR